MSKYTHEQLKEWALEFVREQNENGTDMRALRLIVAIAGITGLETGEVVERIRDIARS